MDVEIGNGLIAIATGAVTEATFAAAERAADLIQQELEAFEFEGEGKGPHFNEHIQVDLNANLAGIEINATSDVPHAVILEEGAPPHVITPRNRRAMMWIEGGLIESSRSLVEGGKIFAKRVFHPGIANPPQPFSRTAAKVEPIIGQMFTDAIASAIGTSGATPLRGILPSSIAAGIRVGRFRSGTRAGRLFLRGARGRFIPLGGL